LSYYKLKDSKFETRGPHRLQPLATNSMDERPNLRYAIPYAGEEIWPEKQWQWSKDRVMKALASDELVFKKAKAKGRWSVSYKQYLRDEEGEARSAKAYSIIDGIYTQQGTNELKDMFGDGKTFSFPKPSKLIAYLLAFIGDKTALFLDSFAGSGTTGHAVLQMNKADGGNRRFICIEMDETIARDVTSQRLKKVVEGYTNAKGEAVEPLGGGFRFCTLGRPLFDEWGNIDGEVKFAELAAHVFFSETGSPLPKRANGQRPLLGTFEGRAVYLLFNGILGDKKPNGGNVLTGAVLESLPKHDGPKVIYGEACRLGGARLRAANVTFKQVPWEVRAG
jgi:adenine-specific DNA-methyltransferase